MYNHAMQDLEDCNVIADTIYAQKERYKSISNDKTKALVVSDSLNKNKDQQIAEKIITETSYKKGEKKQKNINKFLKGIATGFGIIAIIEAGYIGLQSLLKG